MMALPQPKSYEERIEHKIARFPHARQREGLRRIDAEMRAAGNPPQVRLHYIALIADLSAISERTRAARLFRAEADELDRRWERPRRRLDAFAGGEL